MIILGLKMDADLIRVTLGLHLARTDMITLDVSHS